MIMIVAHVQVLRAIREYNGILHQKNTALGMDRKITYLKEESNKKTIKIQENSGKNIIFNSMRHQ